MYAATIKIIEVQEVTFQDGPRSLLDASGSTRTARIEKEARFAVLGTVQAIETA